MQSWKTHAGWLRRRTIMLGAAAGAFGRTTAHAQGETPSDWPSRSLVYINVFTPGGTTDTLSRLFCARLGDLLGQQIVVENRSGAGGTVGQAAIAQSEPDGYTVGLGSVASLSIAPSILPGLPYDPGQDFSFISGIWKVPNILIVNKDVPARTVPELISLLKKQPGRYTYGSSGFGTSPHLSMEMFKQKAGVEVLHIPYRGSAPAMLDLMAGRVQLMFDNMTTAIVAARDGKVRALAVTSEERSKAAPELPVLSDFLSGFRITSWGSLVGPAGMPMGIVERLSNSTREVLGDPELNRRFEENGATAWPTTPQQLADFRAAQASLFADLIRASGAKVPSGG